MERDIRGFAVDASRIPVCQELGFWSWMDN